jgi:hypothetical protein
VIALVADDFFDSLAIRTILTRRLRDEKTAARTWRTRPSMPSISTGAIVGVTVQDADDGDTTTCVETPIEAAEQVETVRPDHAIARSASKPSK